MIYPVFREREIVQDPNAGPQYPAYTVREYRITVHVYLFNQGKTVLRIPTSTLGSAPTRGSSRYRRLAESQAHFEISYGQYLPKAGGTPLAPSIPIVPSSVSLMIMELEPREFAQLTIWADVPAEVKPSEIDFTFHVEEALGARFNTWSGRITKKLLPESKELQAELAAKARQS